MDAQSVINWAVVGQLIIPPDSDAQSLQFIAQIIKLCLQHDFVTLVSQRQLILTCSYTTLCPKKVSPLNILHQPPQTCTHKTTSIFVIDVKFHTNPLFRLLDVRFFQTAITNLSYRYYFFTMTAARSVTSTIWKNDWLKSGVVLITTLLTE